MATLVRMVQPSHASTLRPTPTMIALGDVLCDAMAVLEAPDEYQGAMGLARETVGHGWCRCVTDPRKLQIRQRLGRYHLAVWPEDGERHSAGCPFRRVHDCRAAPSDSTLDADGSLIFSLAQGLVEGVTRSRSAAGATVSGSHGKEGLSLRQLLLALWRQADLDRWLPGWTRDYWRVAKRLEQAVAISRFDARPLAELVQVVPPWREANKVGLEALWAAFDKSLDATHGSEIHPTRILLGEIDHIQRSRYGWQMRLRHTLPVLFFDDALHVDWARQSGLALLHLQRQDPALGQPMGSISWMRVFAAVQVYRSRSGNLRVIRGELLALEKHYMPASNEQEAILCEALVNESRSFLRPVEGERGSLTRSAYVLTDTPKPHPLNVALQGSMHLRKALKLRDGLERASWIWESGQPFPPLPAVAATESR